MTNAKPRPWTRKHLLTTADLSRDEICHMLDTAVSFRDVNQREIKKVPSLRGKTTINLFYENSTRTRTSFELAGKRLSADVINISDSIDIILRFPIFQMQESVHQWSYNFNLVDFRQAVRHVDENCTLETLAGLIDRNS